MLQDLRFAVRTLVKAPAFSVLVILTLAVAVGANTAIFSVVKGVLLNPLPFHESQNLVSIWHSAPGLDMNELTSSPSNYFLYREEARVFDGVGLWRDEAASITGAGEPERVATLAVTHEVLRLLRVQPAAGRLFDQKDDSPAGELTVLLSYPYWQRKFGGDAGVVGQNLTVDGKLHQVIGVLPESFRFLDEQPMLITPMRLNRAEVFIGQFSYRGIARLKPGATVQQANADIARMLPMLLERFPLPPGMSREMLNNARLGPAVRPLKQDAVGNVGDVLWILMGTAAVVLLIACANVANLLLVRGEGRNQELAIRAALGADWWRIGRQLLLESLLLGAAAGALGIPLAYAGVRLLISLRPSNIPRLEEIAIDPAVLAYAAAVSLLTGVLFGLIPILRFAGPKIATALRDAGRGSSAGRQRQYAQSALVVLQVAMALVLLVSSGLMLRTLQELRKVDMGFRDPQKLLFTRVAIPGSQVPEAAAVVRMQTEILRRLQQIPGVESAAIANSVPMDGNTSWDPLFIEDFPEQQGKLPPLRRYKYVSAGYFQTLGNRIVAGRDLRWEATLQQQTEVIVSENLARVYWKEPAQAIGKRVRETPQSPWRTIVGVAGDERSDGAHEPAPFTIYWPLLIEKFWDQQMAAQHSMSFVVRSDRTGTTGFFKEVQNAVWAVNSSLPTGTMRTLADVQRRSMMRTSFTLLMLGVAAGIALLLGVVGIYGVISYAVSQRTREIGIRMALGAQPVDVSRLFLLRGAALTGIGVTLGVATSVGVSRLLGSLLYGVSPVDPATYAGVSAGLLGAALLACYLPARSASRVDPIQALRSE